MHTGPVAKRPRVCHALGCNSLPKPQRRRGRSLALAGKQATISTRGAGRFYSQVFASNKRFCQCGACAERGVQIELSLLAIDIGNANHGLHGPPRPSPHVHRRWRVAGRRMRICPASTIILPSLPVAVRARSHSRGDSRTARAEHHQLTPPGTRRIPVQARRRKPPTLQRRLRTAQPCPSTEPLVPTLVAMEQEDPAGAGAVASEAADTTVAAADTTVAAADTTVAAADTTPAEALSSQAAVDVARVSHPQGEQAEGAGGTAGAPSATQRFPRREREVILDENGVPLSKSAAKRLRRDQAWEANREARKYASACCFFLRCHTCAMSPGMGATNLATHPFDNGRQKRKARVERYNEEKRKRMAVGDMSRESRCRDRNPSSWEVQCVSPFCGNADPNGTHRSVPKAVQPGAPLGSSGQQAAGGDRPGL